MARETATYETALAELAEHVELQAFQGTAGLYAHQRLGALVTRLNRLYDAYELEGDVAPVRREVDAYLADLAAHQLRPDPWVTAKLARFVEALAREDLQRSFEYLRTPLLADVLTRHPGLH